MTDGDGTQSPKTFTQEQVDALITERNQALEANRDEVLAKLAKAKNQAKAFDGLDATEVREKLAMLTELEQQSKAKQAGFTDEQLRKLRDDVRADLEKEYLPYKISAETLGEEVRTLKLDNEVKKLMTVQGVRGERVDALFRLTAGEFDLTEDGKPMLKNDPTREVGKYVAEELSKQYPEFYVGSGSSGGGASKSAGAAGGRVRTIAAGDNAAFLANLEGIASGEVTVTD